MSRNNDYPWIVIGDNATNPGLCLRCGRRLNVLLPQSLSVWIAAFEAFLNIHKHCQESEHQVK